MEYNREFEKIDTEVKAYFLGFAYADGCITTKKAKGNYKKLHFRISLIDKEIIDRFYIEFPFFNYEEFDFSKYREGNSIQYGLRKTNKFLYEDLQNNGMVENKSGVNRHKLFFPTLPDELVRHFIRGYFDGNGSINISANRPNLRRAEICSTSEVFMTQLKDVLQSNNVNCPIFRERCEKRITPLYILEWVNSKDIISLREFFYKDSSISLSRKKEKFDSFEIINVKLLNPECPVCKQREVIKTGNREMKYGIGYRYRCTNCKHIFTLRAQLKQGELLGNPEMDNQQPSLNSNVLEGSTTNSRVLTSDVEDSNADTSALPIRNNGDDIV